MSEDGSDSILPAPVSTPAGVKEAIAKIRHDLRTPLNQIIGYTEMLQEVAAADLQPDLAHVRTAALTLVKGVDRALENVGEMLGVTIGAPKISVSPNEPPAVTIPPEAILPASASAHILVVDDIEMNRVLLHRRLTDRGFFVETCESGEKALERVKEKTFDLILLDVMMPGLNGIEVLKRIRETHSMSELPVIMATARDGSSDVVQALGSGANDYVTKPIDLGVLLARANSQLALKNATEKVRRLAGELEIRNKFIRDTFGRYVTDEVVENLLATPAGLELGGESRTVTVLMSDLRGFSSLSERLSPPQVVAILNRYLGAMTEIIVKYGGTIDEFIGDAILVVFGAPISHPDHSARAVACALEMQGAMDAVNAENVAADLPEIEMGVGINTGEVVVGNIGSSRRAKYGVVGRSVNMASRIEALTVGGQVLIAPSTREELGDSVRIDGFMDVTLKGSSEHMRVYRVGAISGAYSATLASASFEVTTLREPLGVTFTLVEGVMTGSAVFEGTITALSRKRAVLATKADVSLLAMLHLRFLGAPNSASSTAYAKAIDVDSGGSLMIHFTSVSPELEQFLARQLA